MRYVSFLSLASLLMLPSVVLAGADSYEQAYPSQEVYLLGGSFSEESRYDARYDVSDANEDTLSLQENEELLVAAFPVAGAVVLGGGALKGAYVLRSFDSYGVKAASVVLAVGAAALYLRSKLSGGSVFLSEAGEADALAGSVDEDGYPVSENVPNEETRRALEVAANGTPKIGPFDTAEEMNAAIEEASSKYGDGFLIEYKDVDQLVEFAEASTLD